MKFILETITIHNTILQSMSITSLAATKAKKLEMFSAEDQRETKEEFPDSDKIIPRPYFSFMKEIYQETKFLHTFLIFVFCFIPFSLIATMESPLNPTTTTKLASPSLLPSKSHYEAFCTNPFVSYKDYYIFQHENHVSCTLMEEPNALKSPKMYRYESWRKLKGCINSTLKKSAQVLLYVVVPMFSVYQFLQLIVNVGEILKEL